MSTYTNAFGGIAASYRLPFGKHSGRLLSEVPVDYLVWLAESAESPVMRSIARAALGIEEAADEDTTDPSRELAAVAIPGIVFEWQEAMREEFEEDTAASMAVKRGLELLKELFSRFTNRPCIAGRWGCMTPKPAELPIDLGSKLFNEYHAALLRADDAAKRVHAAQIAGDVDTRERAMMDREIAIGDVQRVKENAVADLFLVLRFADEIRPGGLRQLLDPAYRLELDVTQDAIRELEDRLDAAGSAGD